MGDAQHSLLDPGTRPPDSEKWPFLLCNFKPASSPLGLMLVTQVQERECGFLRTRRIPTIVQHPLL